MWDDRDADMSTHPEFRPKPEERIATAPTPVDGVLLIAHGSRRPDANADLVQLSREVAARMPGAIVEFAYLELAEPTVAEGARRCVERGARLVRLFPYFLSLGVHVTRDLEALRRDLSRAYPGVAFVLTRPIGVEPRIVDIVLERLREPAQSL
jgi:sirohydrochlorin ferrochelatase